MLESSVAIGRKVRFELHIPPAIGRAMKFIALFVLSLPLLLTPLACGTAKPARQADPAPTATTETPTGSVAPASDPKAVAKPGRASLEGAIESLIGLLRAKDYRAVIEQFVQPGKRKAERSGSDCQLSS